MRSNTVKSVLIKSGFAAALLLGSGASFAQSVSLTAGPSTATLPDGTAVPMWGYSCSAAAVAPATCAALNPNAGTGWSPVVITVPTGQPLTINLTNALSFGTAPNNIPTSLVIVGQLGGGLGTTATTTASPDHRNAQPATWPIAGDAPGAALTGVGTPPAQGPRVQSFATEVAVGTTPTTLTWSNLRPGTYLIESGTHPSIQGPMGLYGILVVTTAPSGTTAGTAYGTAGTANAVSYSADVSLLFSEIDPAQNNAVSLAVKTTGFKETTVWSGLYGGCGNPVNADGSPNTATFGTCYPPAVNYTPLYYLINGVAFDKTHSSYSLFAAAPGTTASPVAGNVLVRMVNAGLRMHVPSIVGSLTATPAVPGFSLIAEDGFALPGIPRVQNEVFMAAGKTYDVMVNAPATVGTALPVYDRELSLSANATSRDAGMLAYIGINGAALPSVTAFTATATANNDAYNSVIPGNTLTIASPSAGVIANDVNVSNVKVAVAPAQGTLTLKADGTFSYVPNAGWSGPDTFQYCANGTTLGATGAVCATVTLDACTGTCKEAAGAIVMGNISYTSNVATTLSIKPPGVLSADSDPAGHPLTVAALQVGVPVALSGPGAGSVTLDAHGGFSATVDTAGSYTFAYNAQNSQGTVSTSTATVTLVFPAATGPSMVTVLDGKDVLAAKTNPSITPTQITDYRWIIEEDRTFYVNPNCTTNPPPAGCPSVTVGTNTISPTFGTNFHTSYMPVVAAGCTGDLSCESGQTIFDPTTGTHVNAVCDVGNGVCRPGASQAPLMPSQVHLDPTKHYYLTVLPGDAGNPFENGNASADCTNGVASATDPGSCGHGMGGVPLVATCTSAGACTFGPVTVLTQPDPFPPSKLSVFVFEDDFPLNGEQDGGGGIDVLSPNEPGLGGFNITLFDDAGGTGDATGQMTYDMFNQPLVNSLAGTIDPATGIDACPISAISRIGAADTTQTGITGTVVTCPRYEADHATLSPIAGQAVIANLMPGRYGVVATPAADRIARGEEWLQTNTLDGQKAHDSFLRIGEPSFFQEFGPAGFHVSIGFANPQIINNRLKGVCGGTDPNVTGTNCTNSVKGLVSTERMSRTPDERLYGSGSNDSFAFTQCYVSVGDADGEDFAFTKCNSDGTFLLTGLPDGDWRVTVFDQWNDMLVDGLSTPVRLAKGATVDLGQIATNQWQANIYTSSFFDSNGDGVRQASETGLSLVPTNIRFRDGSYSNFNNTDLSGNAGFNEVFPLFSWYVIESDATRYKNTGTHVVYDAGGPADGTPCGATLSPPAAPCGNSAIAQYMANTFETVSVPTNLRVPGAVYCDNADCTGFSIANGPGSSAAPSACTISSTTGATSCTGTPLSTGRIDPPWVLSEGWQGFSGQNSFLEFGKMPYAEHENGGIRGEVTYASTRPFDDPALLIHTSWTPNVPNVTINLYQEGTAADGSQTLTLVDTTKTTSWDDWAQGFRSDGNPNMNCPGQLPAPTTSASGDVFFFTLFDQPMYLDLYNNAGIPAHTMPNNSQFKCYDGMHNWNQLQPAPYDGMYQFPSVAGRDPTTGKPVGGTGSVAGSNCTVCIPDPDTTDPYRSGTPMLPDGKYVVEVVVPPGYELVKEEDKNILIGDNYIAPATQEFPNLATTIYILPDQAEVSAYLNASNAQNQTNAFGRTTLPSHEGDTGSVETFWPCVGAARIVPDYISLFPGSAEVAPFAGATRNLCDRKEVDLVDQTSALAKFWVFTSAHVAAHFTGVITDDFTSEFDPFSPQFGEKFSPANLPVALKDWTGTEISRVYTDQWGTYNGLTYSTWEVNPPNPTGYAPTMMVTCMNDPGTGATPDPLYNPAYSQFCYEIPFMPGQTQYMDTPVVPTSAFAGAGYNNPDCAYPDATPAVSEVDGDAIGPWVGGGGGTHTLKIYALGNQTVNNYGYSGPAATTAPFNQKTVTRHYGFGGTTGTVALVGADGVAHALTGVSWSDTMITGTVPSVSGSGMNCPIQQQTQYGAPSASAQCGELVITTAPSTAHPNGQQSIDTVNVTIGGKAPHHILATDSIQAAFDNASPGDLLIVDPTTQATATTAAVPAVHTEMLLMWKPVRLQGVGAVTSVINANTHPAGKLDDWRRQINCLFGLSINGQPALPLTGIANPYDPTGTYICPNSGTATVKTAKFGDFTTTLRYFRPTSSNPQIDRLPLEAVVGWDASQNGNLAELLQEPSLMGALEGAAITVLSKGMQFPNGSDPFGLGGAAAGGFPTGTSLLTGSNGNNGGRGCNNGGTNPFPSNFYCNPSSIDGMGITDSSQGGGGIFVHGWGHNLQIANNRINNNAGTLSGGINVGQGEFPPSYTVGGTNADPGSCQNGGGPTGTQQQYCFDVNVNMHHNAITSNSSTGDELFSATPAGAGGVSICNGSDYYKFNYNWVCGNLSTGDGGGIGHIGFNYNGDIEHNTILFNQSTNPTIASNGGGILVMGAPDVDPTCGLTTDQDCVPATPNAPGDGVGPNLVINANLIMGNAAEAGSGGGLRLQNVNGTDVLTFPRSPNNWYKVTVTNNIIADNVAGWDGAGISLQDALNVNIINNTIMSNDTTASSGVLFNTLGAPLASSSGPTCTSGCGTASAPQPAGVVAIQNSSNMTANLPGPITCPTGHPNCATVSYPELYNNVFWQNRSFYIGVGGLGTGAINQQNVVALYNAFTGTVPANQTVTGACPNGSSYWDIGVRGDTGPTNHASTVTLAPTYSVITNTAGYTASALHNTQNTPTVISQYCNGSRVPPENGGLGYDVPAGISDATVPNPIFSLTPAATVDEGNNWINLSWGPLSLVNPVTLATLGNYSPAAGSSVINYIPSSASTYSAAPSLDFFGTQRKSNNIVDAGAVEFTGTVATTLSAAVSPSPLAFGTWANGTTSDIRTLTVTNTGTGALAGGTYTFGGGSPQPFARITSGTFPAGAPNCGATLAVGASCTIKVTFAPATGTTNGTAFTRTLTVAYTGATVTPTPVQLTGTAVTARATVTITPNPLTITLPSCTPFTATCLTNTGVVTLTNTAAAGGSQVLVSRVAAAGGSFFTYSFTNGALAGPDTCTGAAVAPGTTCTATVRFTNIGSARGANRSGTVTFTDTATGSPQVGNLIGFATP